MLNTITGTYGSNKIPCDMFTYYQNGGTWYVVEGSCNVNFTYDNLYNGVDVETLMDYDCFTWSNPIESEEELEVAFDF